MPQIEAGMARAVLWMKRICVALSALALLLALVAARLASASTQSNSPSGTGNERTRLIDGKPFSREGEVSAAQLQALRNEAQAMFRFGFENYMQKAFPKDDLRPISCRGSNSQGGIALTLIDALDTLILLGDKHEVRRAVMWLGKNLSFDVDERVHVFELTIRALGGLLSTHTLLLRDPKLVPQYDGSLLRLAQDLGDRLLPAFDTPTGIPLSWVNMAKGVEKGETRATCTACAGTLVLEFGLLSQLTGDDKYERHAHHALIQLFQMRSRRTGLPGNTLNVDTATWVRKDSGIGAGIDSFYEYLLKAWLVFGNRVYLDMFVRLYTAAMSNLQVSNVFQRSWLVDVHMDTGRLARPWVSSLGAFWPGMQALFGQVEDAEVLHGNLTDAWREFGWLPELFDLGLTKQHPIEKGYPLRPELIESTYLLHLETGNPQYIEIARDLQATLMERNRQRCGFASVRDVSTGELEDSMESFFLSETSKYLYLIHSNAPDLLDHFVFSTEGHLIPPLPARDGSGPPLPPAEEIPENCRRVCSSGSSSSSQGAHQGVPQQSLSAAFPLLRVDEGLNLIRPRRCLACVEATKAMAKQRDKIAAAQKAAQEAAAAQQSCSAQGLEGEDGGSGTCLAGQDAGGAGYNLGIQEWLAGAGNSAPGQDQSEVLFQVTCTLQWAKAGLICASLDPLKVDAGTTVDQLPQNVVVLQLTAVHKETPSVKVQYSKAEGQHEVAALLASFGPVLQQPSESSGGQGGEKQGGESIAPKALQVVTGDLAAPEQLDGCIIESSMAGKIALIERGSCSFMHKVEQAERAGAVGVIVVNSLEDGAMLTMGTDGSGIQPEIISVAVSRESGTDLREALQEGTSGKQQTVTVMLRPAEASERIYVSASTQINMLIPPNTQMWLFGQAAATGADLSQALQTVLGDPDVLAEQIAAMKEAAELMDAGAGECYLGNEDALSEGPEPEADDSGSSSGSAAHHGEDEDDL